MAHTHDDLPHIGRDAIVEKLLARLCRPDDLRESPKEFIHPGFYGLGGVGKSRLLREVTARARAEKLTPYVLLIDFDPRAAALPPATPLQFVQRLIDGLEAIDRDERPFWQRAVWGQVNPFRECRRLIAETVKSIQQSQTVTAEGPATEERESPPGLTIHLFLWWARLRGQNRAVAHALRGLAASALALAQYDQAQRHDREALAIYQRIGDPLGEAHALRGLADSALALSQYDQTQDDLAHSLAIARAIGIPAAGLSWCVVLGQRALDAAEAHAKHGETRQSAAARRLAQQCYDWAGEFLRDPNLPPAGQRYVQSYHSLGVRLASQP